MVRGSVWISAEVALFIKKKKNATKMDSISRQFSVAQVKLPKAKIFLMWSLTTKTDSINDWRLSSLFSIIWCNCMKDFHLFCLQSIGDWICSYSRNATISFSEISILWGSFHKRNLTHQCHLMTSWPGILSHLSHLPYKTVFSMFKPQRHLDTSLFLTLMMVPLS